MKNNMSSCSSSPDRHDDNPHQSQWLQSTLSELDKKMKTMMTLLDEDDKKPELKQMLQDFNRSYRSLAEEYDQLRCKSHHVLHSGSSSSPREIRGNNVDNRERLFAGSLSDPIVEAFDFHSDSAVEDDDDAGVVECNSASYDFKYLNKLADELMMSTEPCKVSFETKIEISEDNEMDKESGWENGNIWPDMKFQVTKLIEENLRQQAELLKRNDEKRKAIKGLRAELEHLKSENRTLRCCLRLSKVDLKRNSSQVSSLKEHFFDKLLRAVGCS